MIALALLASVTAPCHPVDGDTIRCGPVTYRLLAIEAADDPRSLPCRQRKPHYVCDLARYQAGKRHMAKLIKGKRITIRETGKASWGRPVVRAYADGRSIGCDMLASGLATYAVRFDRGGQVKKECGL